MIVKTDIGACEYMDKEGDGEIVNKRKEQRNHASPRAKETTSDEWKQKNKKSGWIHISGDIEGDPSVQGKGQRRFQREEHACGWDASTDSPESDRRLVALED